MAKSTSTKRGTRTTSGERWSKYRKTRAVVVAYLTPQEQALFKEISSGRGLSMSALLSQLVKAFINREFPE